MTQLSEKCLERQAEFDDALGPEVLFVFFDPDVSPRTMTEHAAAVGRRFQEGPPATSFSTRGWERHTQCRLA